MKNNLLELKDSYLSYVKACLSDGTYRISFDNRSCF